MDEPMRIVVFRLPATLEWVRTQAVPKSVALRLRRALCDSPDAEYATIEAPAAGVDVRREFAVTLVTE